MVDWSLTYKQLSIAIIIGLILSFVVVTIIGFMLTYTPSRDIIPKIESTVVPTSTPLNDNQTLFINFVDTFTLPYLNLHSPIIYFITIIMFIMMALGRQNFSFLLFTLLIIGVSYWVYPQYIWIISMIFTIPLIFWFWKMDYC